MFEVRNGIKYIIIFYIIASVSLYYMKPNLMFDKNTVKKFGLGYGKTVFSYQLVLIFLAFIMFYIFELVWLRKNNFL